MSQEKSKRTLSYGTIAGYTVGGMFSLAIQLSFLDYMLMAFLTESAGFSTVLAASIFSAANIVKLVSMILSGIMIDGTRLKWGKYRSWSVIGGILMLLTTGLAFTNLKGMSPSVYAVVFLIIFFINQTGYNVSWTASRALVGPMSKTSADGVLLTSGAQIGYSAAGVVYGLISAGIMAMFASSASPFAGPGWIYGAITLLGGLLMFFIARKYDGPANVQAANASAGSADKVGFIEMLKSMKGQGAIFMIGTTFGNIQLGFFFTLLFYFTTYVLKDPAALGLAVTWSSIGGFIGAFIAPAICTKLGKKKVYIIAHYLSAVLYLAMFLFGRTAVPFLIIRVMIGFVGTFAGVTLPALGNDLADYNEMKGQSHARAFVQSMVGASIRIGGLIASVVAAYGLAAVGYSNGVEPTASVQTGISALMGVAPAVVCILAAVIMHFFRVDEHELDEYRRKKAEQA